MWPGTAIALEGNNAFKEMYDLSGRAVRSVHNIGI